MTTTISATSNQRTAAAASSPSPATINAAEIGFERGSLPHERHVQSFLLDFRTQRPAAIARLPAQLFLAPVRVDILHQCVVYELARRRGVVYRNQSGRGEWRGSRRKLWPQKRMGRARIGDRGSPVAGGACRWLIHMTTAGAHMIFGCNY